MKPIVSKITWILLLGSMFFGIIMVCLPGFQTILFSIALSLHVIGIISAAEDIKNFLN
jgi:hypothetical protein